MASGYSDVYSRREHHNRDDRDRDRDNRDRDYGRHRDRRPEPRGRSRSRSPRDDREQLNGVSSALPAEPRRTSSLPYPTIPRGTAATAPGLGSSNGSASSPREAASKTGSANSIAKLIRNLVNLMVALVRAKQELEKADSLLKSRELEFERSKGDHMRFPSIKAMTQDMVEEQRKKQKIAHDKVQHLSEQNQKVSEALGLELLENLPIDDYVKQASKKNNVDATAKANAEIAARLQKLEDGRKEDAKLIAALEVAHNKQMGMLEETYNRRIAVLEEAINKWQAVGVQLEKRMAAAEADNVEIRITHIASCKEASEASSMATEQEIKSERLEARLKTAERELTKLSERPTMARELETQLTKQAEEVESISSRQQDYSRKHDEAISTLTRKVDAYVKKLVHVNATDLLNVADFVAFKKDDLMRNSNAATQAITTMGDRVGVLEGRLSHDLARLPEAVTELHQESERVKSLLATMGATVETHGIAIGTLQAQHAESRTRHVSVPTASTQGAPQSLAGDIVAATQRFSKIEDTIKRVATFSEALAQMVGGWAARIDSIELNDKQLSENVKALRTAVEPMQTQIQQLAGRVTMPESTSVPDNVKAALESVKADLDSLRSDLTGRLTALGFQVQTLDTRFNNLTTNELMDMVVNHFNGQYPTFPGTIQAQINKLLEHFKEMDRRVVEVEKQPSRRQTPQPNAINARQRPQQAMGYSLPV